MKQTLVIFLMALCAAGTQACGSKATQPAEASAEAQNASEAAPDEGADTAAPKEFDFEKYHKSMVEQAEGNLLYMKSDDDIRLVDYALIDIDGDGRPEVWVRGDGGQDFQGVYAITPDDEPVLIQSSDARSELSFFHGAVAANGYYGEGEFRGFATKVKNSAPADFGFKRVLIDNYSEDEEVLEEDYNVNDKNVTEAEYDAFYKSLGEPYTPEVTWHSVRPLPPSAD